MFPSLGYALIGHLSKDLSVKLTRQAGTTSAYTQAQLDSHSVHVFSKLQIECLNRKKNLAEEDHRVDLL